MYYTSLIHSFICLHNGIPHGSSLCPTLLPSSSLTPASTRLGSLTLLRLPPLHPPTAAGALLLLRVHPKDPGGLSWLWYKSMKKGVWRCEFLFYKKDNWEKDKFVDLFCSGESTKKVILRLCERVRLMSRGSDFSEGLMSGGLIQINSLMIRELR